TGNKKTDELGQVFHYDLYGKREFKYQFLLEETLKKINFNEVKYSEPYYFFIPKNDFHRTTYEEGFKVNDLLSLNTSGFASANDDLNISFSPVEQERKIKDILEMDESQWRTKYNKKKDSRDWQYLFAKDDA